MSRIATEELRQIVDAALPGPWGWFGYPDDLKLATTHSGRRYVMDFVRKGFSRAQPRFQPDGRGMVPADRLLRFEVGDQSVRGEKEARADGGVYRYDVRGVDCADARLIALAPQLAAEVLELREALTTIVREYDPSDVSQDALTMHDIAAAALSPAPVVDAVKQGDAQ